MRHLTVVATALAATAALAAAPAKATEGGASVYLLGSGGPGAAILPPVEGWFFANTLYRYEGSGGGAKQFPFGGNVVAGVDATITADFATGLWVPTTNLAGGVLAVGAALPVGRPEVDAQVLISGPRGAQIGRSIRDSGFMIGDPLLTASWGWSRDEVHVAASGLLNIPIGDYREQALANLAFHRWALDTSLAVTWHDDKLGWDASAKAGVTFNGKNDDTDYDSGNEFHLEGALEKSLDPAWAVGLQAYYLDQISGDSGAGAKLGPFEGTVAGVGATLAYNFKIGQKPATLRLHGVEEFAAKNRLEGRAVWLDFSVPLQMKLPPRA